MLYLNCESSSKICIFCHLTLTNVVFEFWISFVISLFCENLTLTNVVFECFLRLGMFVYL